MKALELEHEAKLKVWEETIAEIEAYERLEQERVQSSVLLPPCCAQAVWWLQMWGCLIEVFFWVPYHVLHALLALPLMWLGAAHLMFCNKWDASQGFAHNFENASATLDGKAKYFWPVLPWAQWVHHVFRAELYSKHFFPMIWRSILAPSQPFLMMAVMALRVRDVALIRPTKPRKPPELDVPAGKDRDCCSVLCAYVQPCCRDACAAACRVCSEEVELVVQTFERSFIVLSCCHALQCGTLCGPCVRPCCYDPCVGKDTESGRCRLCEAEEIRTSRWRRERQQAMLRRTISFFDARPHLMRPEMAHHGQGTVVQESITCSARPSASPRAPPQAIMSNSKPRSLVSESHNVP